MCVETSNPQRMCVENLSQMCVGEMKEAPEALRVQELRVQEMQDAPLASRPRRAHPNLWPLMFSRVHSQHLGWRTASYEVLLLIRLRGLTTHEQFTGRAVGMGLVGASTLC